MIMMSVKFQMVLPEDLAARMKAVAAAKKIPLAQYVRETMEERIKNESRPDGMHLFEWLRGRGTDIKEADLAARVDEYLYGGDPYS